ncbi:hypothetical protein LCGC14_2203000 [marine sediment metagenome]|uniref:Phage major capsid protein n=1 Tax=marine sediment metagenome TaxID=412755 RepID=A0A0F9DG90_9ZZZZ
MDITMLEAAKHSKDALEASVAKIIVETSPVLEYLPQKTINGPAFRYHREASLGSMNFRGVGGTYTPDAGVINPIFEPLVILGGEVKVDNFEVEVMSNLLNLKAEKYRMKARQAGIIYSETFFEGDTAVDAFQFDGLRKRLTGGQKISMGTNGLALTLAKLDEALDAVLGDGGDKTIWCSPQTRREITTLVRAVSGSGLINFTQDAFGKQQMAYAGTPIRVVRREDDGTSFFGYDETQGSSSVTASLYITRMGSDFLHGIQSKSLPTVKDFGEVEAGPFHLGRIEWYTGLVLKHPRAAVRIHGILAA